MKKHLSVVAAVVGLVAASVAVANPSSGYFSTLHPASQLSAAAMVPATDISIINASPSYFYVDVPNAVYDQVVPGVNDHIRHPTYTGNTFMDFHDYNGNVFWSGSLCRYAIVTVYGYTSANVGVDNELCN